MIFCGSGSTAAIDKLIGILGLRIPAASTTATTSAPRSPPTSDRSSSSARSSTTPTRSRWRETIADVVTIHEDADGRVVARPPRARSWSGYADRPLKIGSFSAASNVTGIVTDTEGVADLLHRHGALSFWDFAACAPYVDIEMYGARHARVKDAIFISPAQVHRRPGHPGRPRRPARAARPTGCRSCPAAAR